MEDITIFSTIAVKVVIGQARLSSKTLPNWRVQQHSLPSLVSAKPIVLNAFNNMGVRKGIKVYSNNLG
jgi:hypothetical protein